MVKVHYNVETGEIIGFYPDHINYATIPTPTIEVTEETHADCYNNPGRRKVDVATGKIVECEPPQLTNDQLFDILRAERTRRLAECDWTQLADAPLTAAQKTAWKDYRQALRDLPENTADPANPVWPNPPF